jgi:hypothetical protein
MALIIFADFSNNQGTTKSIVLVSFVLLYVWYTIPGILLIASYKIRKNFFLSTIIALINIFSSVHAMPMLIEYVGYLE